MEADLTSVFETTIDAPVGKIIQCYSETNMDSGNCETFLQTGIFFDGTGNNMYRDSDAFGETNVARLWRSYPENKVNGTSKVYVPGVGTPFPQVGESGESTFGTAFGSGCFRRIIYALLRLLNALSFMLDNNNLFSPSDIRKIIANEFKSDNDQAGVCRFMMSQIKLINEKRQNSKVQIRGCFLDIFGFSRGAAEARVFTTWLIDLLQDGKFGGIPLTVRFLGIFDTVASAGVVGSIGNTIVNSTGGHTGWAEAKFLRIRKEVKNCVHMVAMHEIRKNFPLDEVSVAGLMPANCHEYAYPGGHSDIGGGYEPGQLGIACGEDLADGDKRKLSQIRCDTC